LLNDEAIDVGNLDDSQEILCNAFEKICSEIHLISDINLFINKFLSLEFVVIKSTSEEDAYQLFEGLNSTGLSLSAVELTKNAILGKVKQLSPEKISLAIEIWNSIEKKFEDVNGSWFKKFLRHQWFSKNGYTSDAELFREIKKHIINNADTTADKIIEYLRELEDDSLIYISFRTSNMNKAVFDISMTQDSWNTSNGIIGHIEKLGLDQIYSVLLALYKYGKKNKEYFHRGESFKKHIEKLWMFLFIVKFTKVSPSSFERNFAKICKDIQSEKYSIFKNAMDDFFKDKLKTKISNLKDDFSNTLSQSLDYFNDDRVMMKYILESYLLIDGVGSDVDVTAEHIVPENNLNEWSVGDEGRVKKFVGNIGNMTLLSRDLNEDAGHKNFNDKYDVAYAKSRFTVNNKLKDDWGKGFCSLNPVVDAIIPRGKKIGELIYDNYLLKLG